MEIWGIGDTWEEAEIKWKKFLVLHRDFFVFLYTLFNNRLYKLHFRPSSNTYNMKI